MLRWLHRSFPILVSSDLQTARLVKVTSRRLMYYLFVYGYRNAVCYGPGETQNSGLWNASIVCIAVATIKRRLFGSNLKTENPFLSLLFRNNSLLDSKFLFLATDVFLTAGLRFQLQAHVYNCIESHAIFLCSLSHAELRARKKSYTSAACQARW